MEPIFRQTHTVDALATDRFGKLKPSMLLYYLQEAAGAHFATLEDKTAPIAGKRLFWAVTRHRLVISRLPRLGEKITVETWPMPTTRVAYPRAVAFYDENGRELARAISLWVLMDMESRAMVLPGKSGVTVNGILRGCEPEVPKSLMPKELPNSVTHTVTYSLLDKNGHMNNTRYLDWVSDLLPAAFHQSHCPAEIVLCYLSEALEGQHISLCYGLSEAGELTVDAHRASTSVCAKTERVFSAQVRYL